MAYENSEQEKQDKKLKTLEPSKVLEIVKAMSLDVKAKGLSTKDTPAVHSRNSKFNEQLRAHGYNPIGSAQNAMAMGVITVRPCVGGALLIPLPPSESVDGEGIIGGILGKATVKAKTKASK